MRDGCTEKHPIFSGQAWAQWRKTPHASSLPARTSGRPLPIPRQTAKVFHAVVAVLLNDHTRSEPRRISDYDKFLSFLYFKEVWAACFAFNNCSPLNNARVQL